MKQPKHVLIGLAVAAVIAAVVVLLAFLNLSAPRKRTVTIEPRRLNVDEAAARKEVDRRITDYRARGERILVADFKPKPLDPKDNAAEPYLAAIKWLEASELHQHPVWDLEIDPATLTGAQWQTIDDALTKYAPALALIDQADGRDAADWKVEFKSPALRILLRSLNGARQSQRLLRMAALSAHRAGRDDEAVRRIIQMTAFTRHVDSGHPALVGHLVASGLARLTAETVADVVPTLKIARTGATPQDGAASRQQVNALIAALLDPRTLQHGWVQSTLAERMFMHDSYESLIDGRVTMQEIFGDPRDKSATTIPTPPSAELLADLAPMLDYNTALVAAAKADRLPEFRKRHPTTPATHSHVARNLLPSYDRAALTHYAALTELRLAAAAIAVRAWSAEHDGALPESLEELVPTYLPAVPDDPMVAAPATILYRDGMVYSAGVDEGKRRSAARAGAATTQLKITPDYAIRLQKQ